MGQKNFARGEAPPSHSWEWAGTPTPPGTTGSTRVSPPGTKQNVPIVLAISETIVVAKKKRSWLGLIAAGAGGFLLGYGTGKKR